VSLAAGAGSHTVWPSSIHAKCTPLVRKPFLLLPRMCHLESRDWSPKMLLRAYEFKPWYRSQMPVGSCTLPFAFEYLSSR
jgi:hypothetical protein